MAYKSFLYRCNNIEEVNDILKLLVNCGYEYVEILENDFSKYNFYILVQLNKSVVAMGTGHSEQDVIDVVNKYHPLTDPYIYDARTIRAFKSRVNLINVPNYRPKKFLRESNTHSHPYRFKTEDEFIEEYGPDWMTEIGRLSSIKWVGNMNYLFGTELTHPTEILDDSGYILIPNTNQNGPDYWYITKAMITNNKPLVPNYLPKKFNRTLEGNLFGGKIKESITYKYYNPITKKATKYPYRFKTLEDFRNEYGYCWRDRIKPPSWADDMNNLFGKDYEYELSEMNKKLHKPRSERYVDSNGEDWAISWNMIMKNEELKPNYLPKKFDRTLESTLIESSQMVDSYISRLDYNCIILDKPNINITKIKYILSKYEDIIINERALYNLNNRSNTIFILPLILINSENANFHLDRFKNYYDYNTELDDIIKEYPKMKIKLVNTEEKLGEELYKIFKPVPNYLPKKFDRTLESTLIPLNKVLNAFDMDDTLVYSTRFEEHIKPLLVREFLTPEIILKNKVNDISIEIKDLKYENGRIYFDDPKQLINISSSSSWVRKKDRVYITQPDAYFMTEESMPIGVNQKIVDLYNKSKYKAIITARHERLRSQTEEALKNLNVELPNCGLFMYPDDSFSLKVRWKTDKLLELMNNEGFSEIHYYDDNIKILKKMKVYLKKYENIKLYKVNGNNFREV